MQNPFTHPPSPYFSTDPAPSTYIHTPPRDRWVPIIYTEDQKPLKREENETPVHYRSTLQLATT